jgi:hypothetical protein
MLPLFAEFMIGDTAQIFRRRRLFLAHRHRTAAGLARSRQPEDHRRRQRLYREGDLAHQAAVQRNLPVGRHSDR